MKKVRAMCVRPRVLPWLIGALALALVTGEKASAATCLLSSSGWYFQNGTGSVDGVGTVTLPGDAAFQGPIAAQHPVLTGTVQNGDAQAVGVALYPLDPGGG